MCDSNILNNILNNILDIFKNELLNLANLNDLYNLEENIINDVKNDINREKIKILRNHIYTKINYTNHC